jgi:hypothetical protein
MLAESKVVFVINKQGANDMSKIATLKMSTGKKSQAQSPAHRQQALAPQILLRHRNLKRGHDRHSGNGCLHSEY